MSASGMAAGRTVVIGVGNEFRRDDGVGPAVVERLRGQLPAGVELVVSDGDPARLIEAWSGATLAVVVDAVRANPARPGRRRRFVMGGDPRRAAPAEPGVSPAPSTQGSSTHGLGVDAAVGLALALDRMPQLLIVHAIEAADLTRGAGMTPQVAAAVAAAAAAVRRDVTTPP